MTQPRTVARTVALVGRQNAGKTSLLMALTGSQQRPINFAGSSVERTEAFANAGPTRLRIVDLPGVTSLEPISPDEKVALDWLDETLGLDTTNAPSAPDPSTPAAPPAVLCLVLDADKLSVELSLALDLLRLPVPTVVALTKVDIASREVDASALSRELGIPVIPINARTGQGKEALLEALAAATPRTATLAVDNPARPEDRTARSRRALSIATAASRPRPTTSTDPTTSTGTPTLTDRLDKVLLHRVFGLPILLVLVFGIFQLLFTGAEPLMGLIESAQSALAGLVESDDLGLDDGALRSFLIDGLINGVGSVLVFLPQIIILIFLLSLLEASGYMARAAFLLDRILSTFGLSGRSFVPMASSMACAVPGILATRVIADERERLATIAVLPLMSCSARLPVYVILIGAFFPTATAGVVLLSLYLLGIIIACLVAYLLRRTRLRGDRALLLMELPVYQPPAWKVVWGQVKSATREFLVLAGTIIVATSVVIWLLSYYPRPSAIADAYDSLRAPLAAADAHLPEPTHTAEPDADADPTASIDLGVANATTSTHTALSSVLDHLDASEKAAFLEQSWLAGIGKAVQPVFGLAGMDWRTTVGVIAAFPARELIIPTLGILYSLGDVDAGQYDLAYLDTLGPLEKREHSGDSLTARLMATKNDDGTPAWSPLIALAVMVFFALCSQCMATLGAIYRETRTWRWPVFVFTYMTTLAWVMAVLVYQVGSALGFGGAS